ncbi:MAG: DUF4340 domain-containing protein [Planctomycetota bacterium]|nr:MAG: DUF4340 domain-containing protein [Planctomycetota bacterium]
MNPARLFVLVLVLVLLVAGAGWLVFGRPPAPAAANGEEAASSSPGLLGPAAEELARLTIHLPDRPTIVRLRRQGPRLWRLEEPWLDRADPAAVEAVIRALRFDRPEPLREDWRGRSDADLGLEPPAVVAELELAGGRRHELRVGTPDLTGSRYVVRFDGERRLVGVALVRTLDRPPQQWRDPALFADPGAVAAIEWFPRDGAGFRLERSGMRWRLTAPEEFLLSPAGEGMVARLLRARADSLPEEVATEEEIQVFEAGDRLVLHRPGAPPVRVWLAGGGILASDRPYPLLVQAGDFRLLHTPLEDLRSPYLFDLVPGEIVSLELTVGGRSGRFRRRAPGWFGPDGELLPPAEQKHLDELVARVCTIRPQRPGVPAPAREPDGRLVLSRSLQPKAASGAELWWWSRPDGMPWVAAAGTAEATEVDFNLHLGAAAMLPD